MNFNEQNPSNTHLAVFAAEPVTFAGTIGLYTPARQAARKATAVLFVSPWGFEEMCTRKFFRILAEGFAEAGVANLRFDYAGTGDALDVTDHSRGMAVWLETAEQAASQLKSLSRCDSIILVSQGLGSAVALELAQRLGGVDGVALMAPAISGRLYLRELSVWSKMIDDGMGVPESQRETQGVSIAGLRMPEEIAAEVRKLNLMNLAKVEAANCLVLTRPNRSADEDFAAHIRELQPATREVVYRGYDELVFNPTIATMPAETGDALVEWVESISKPIAGASKLPQRPAPVPLATAEFREMPLRFGKANELYGILCEPTAPRRGATAIILTTAYDRTAGWGRTSVKMARELARDGIPSLRFDNANVADSPPTPGAPEQVLYFKGQNDEITAALDLLESCKLLPAVLVGRCSGGYLAFQASLSDKRSRGLVAANPYVLHWDGSLTVDASLRHVPRSLETYGLKLLQLETLRRLLRGDIDGPRAIKNFTTSVIRRAIRHSRPLLDFLPFRSPERNAILELFQSLKARKVDVSLIYTARDTGLEQFNDHFGKEGSHLKRYSNVRLSIIPEADHNLTQAHAQTFYLQEVRSVSLKVGTRQTAPKEERGRAVISRKYANSPTS
ncbi:serine aminopeptidase domain-containing protein [Rhizobium sp. P32RR-XVIII]|uniref:serine aminopeptidase domain-containing protein n=1 Tax=Rhizobium sp. P32RR-XVIII TaxID=2726738 RepID=UPI001FF05D7A|nr:alpha/beta hydrolase [Rhizobium sp. P32RR-XVIII]